MNPVTPRLKAPMVLLAEDQPEFEPIKVALVSHPDFDKHIRRVKLQGETHWTSVEMNSVVMAFKPTREELVRMLAGEEVYISLLTWGKPQPAIIVSVGPETATRDYNLEPA